MSRTIVVFAALAGVVLLGLFLVSPRMANKKGPVQPINYNHKVHIEKAGMNCTDCHAYAEKLASASIPTLETCQNCHNDTPLSQSPEETKLLNHVAEKKEIPWARIYKLPDHVYFSHRRHVVRGKLDCAECHGVMAELTEAVSIPAKPVTMENCLRCHQQTNASTDCLACHR